MNVSMDRDGTLVAFVIRPLPRLGVRHGSGRLRTEKQDDARDNGDLDDGIFVHATPPYNSASFGQFPA